jgi:16S rRNA (cytosine967-C5)-methyltransferase
VYSTCTLEPEENEEVVETFLADNPDFEPAPPTEEELLGGSLFAQELTLSDLPLTDEGWLQVLPQETGFDGAFAARLRRRDVREAPTPATGAGGRGRRRRASW